MSKFRDRRHAFLFVFVCIVLAPQSSRAAEPDSPSAVEQILAALDKPLDWDFVEVPLADVVKRLEQQTGVAIRVDLPELREIGIGGDTPVTRQIKGIRLRHGLNLITRDLDIAWTIEDKELVITSPDKAENLLTLQVYPVRDLVSYWEFGERKYDTDSLVEEITLNLTDSLAWDEVGGRGSISTFGDVLVVNQRWPLQIDLS